LASALVVAGCARGTGGGSGDVDARIGPPIDATIDSNGCAVQPCVILPQCGCTGNTACDVDVSDLDGTACRTINASGTSTSTCTNSMECDTGFVCLGDDDFASCKQYCVDDADCGAPRGRCIYTITDNNNQPIADIPNVCSSNCDPLSTNNVECPSTYKCTLFSQPTYKVVDCSPAGAGTQGTACANDTGCARGYQCVTFGSNPSRCARICDTAVPVCPSSTSCIGFTDPMIVGGTTYGVCGP
jgi:hypothetical protein